MEQRTMRIEIKVDGKLVEVYEFNTNQRDPISSFWDFIKSFNKSIQSWNFDKFFGE